MPNAFVASIIAAILSAPSLAAADTDPGGRQIDPTRSTPVHRIPLYDEMDEKIDPAADPARAYSPRVTCGKCHDYKTVSRGWHFNAADASVPPGRPGEPWILTDARTGTQLPLSYRRWPGTYRPEEVGMSPWRFTQTFGRHLPGGSVSEKVEPQPDPTARWEISGRVEIDCQRCHSGSPAYDASAYATAMQRENFRHAATAAQPFGYVRGYAKGLPDTFDPLLGQDPDHPEAVPTAVYNKAFFNPAGEVFFDVPRGAPDRRCLFCHSVNPVNTGHRAELGTGTLFRKQREKAEPVPNSAIPGVAIGSSCWQRDVDVHAAAGLRCVDCHRNGLDHSIVRGYEGEVPFSPRPSGDALPSAAPLTCRGCHLGEEAVVLPGRLGAPRPVHAGIPQRHLDKLTCTACHSGPWPGEQAARVQTAMAHAMGIHGQAPAPGDGPMIYEPVFRRNADGKIEPARVLFPAFWGRLEGKKVMPILPDEVIQAAGKLLPAAPLGREGLTKDRVAAVLEALRNADPPLPRGAGKEAGLAQNSPPRKGGVGEEGTALVFIAGGLLHRLDDRGMLIEERHPAAEPYAWPVAHDVRPAGQSLGSGGCTDCHVADSPLLFGKLTPERAGSLGDGPARSMCEFTGLDATRHAVFAATFVFRPWLKVTGFLSAGVILLVLAAHAAPAVRAVTRRAAQPRASGTRKDGR